MAKKIVFEKERCNNKKLVKKISDNKKGKKSYE